jgi:glucose-6-phosphate isomerase
MQLPDEAIAYHYQGLLVVPTEVWVPATELRHQHFLPAARLKDLVPRVMQAKTQVYSERELTAVPAELKPLDAGFIDLPQKLLDEHRRRAEASLLGRILARAQRLREDADRVVVLDGGGSHAGARALFEALRSHHHNELPPETRLGVPRVYFEGDGLDSDAFQELLDLLQVACVDPAMREERWGTIVVSRVGDALETAVALRALRREAVEFYGHRSEMHKRLFVPVTGAAGRMRDLVRAEGYADDEVFVLPDNVGGRCSVFTAAGLLPAAVMGLDVRGLLLGAAAMTKRFLEEPFERNPVLQYAAVNYLMTTTCQKPVRVLSIWSKKLEALGLWYEQLVSESLGKQGGGPTALSTVQPRDLYSRGQKHQDGPRDKVTNNLVVKAPRQPPVPVGMADRNEDGLNPFARKTYPDLLDAAVRGANQAQYEVARPTADLVVPALSEHTMGQLMQMLMLATVVEGKLMGVNPYGQPGVEAYRRNMAERLKSEPPHK